MCRRRLFETIYGPTRFSFELYHRLRREGAPLPQRSPLRDGLELNFDEELALLEELMARYRIILVYRQRDAQRFPSRGRRLFWVGLSQGCANRFVLMLR